MSFRRKKAGPTKDPDICPVHWPSDREWPFDCDHTCALPKGHRGEHRCHDGAIRLPDPRVPRRV